MLKLFLCFWIVLSVNSVIFADIDKSLYSNEITADIWKAVKPYLMHEDHPLKPKLDLFFGKSRILKSVETLEASGFEIIFQQLHRGLIVVRHPWLSGYLIKLYLDSSPRSEWPLWVLRAKGARKIQKAIDKYECHRFLKVPKKWIYPISAKRRPKSDDETFPKDFVLVVTDMRLAKSEKSLAWYKKGVMRAHLKALYTLITEAGLSDSHIANIPISKDGRTAFIDTEYVGSWPVHLDWLTDFFSPVNQQYWQSLIDDGIEEKF